MVGSDTQQKQIGWLHRRGFRVDTLLLVFLLVGWSLIFTAATLGLQPIDQQWLPVGLVSQAAADYSAKTSDAPKMARIELEVIDAIRQDQILRASPTPSAVAQVATPTLTLEPTPTPTFAPSDLEVSAGGPYSGRQGLTHSAGAGTAPRRALPASSVPRYHKSRDDRPDYSKSSHKLRSRAMTPSGERS